MRASITFILLLLFLTNHASAEAQFSCRKWLELTQVQKIQAVEAFIQVAKEEDGIILRLSPLYYAREVDDLIKTYAETENEDALDSSVGTAIHSIAAMEGDWDKGENKLKHAMKYMGPEAFRVFKERFPDKYERLKAGRLEVQKF